MGGNTNREPLKDLIARAQSIFAQVADCQRQTDAARKAVGIANGKIAALETRLDAEHLVLQLQDQQIDALIKRVDRLQAYADQTPWQHLWTWVTQKIGVRHD